MFALSALILFWKFLIFKKNIQHKTISGLLAFILYFYFFEIPNRHLTFIQFRNKYMKQSLLQRGRGIPAFGYCCQHNVNTMRSFGRKVPDLGNKFQVLSLAIQRTLFLNCTTKTPHIICIRLAPISKKEYIQHTLLYVSICAYTEAKNVSMSAHLEAISLRTIMFNSTCCIKPICSYI